MRLDNSGYNEIFRISEATAFYLQKYIVYRKRKIFYGDGRLSDMVSVMKNTKKRTLLPLSDIHKPEIPELLDAEGISIQKAILYRTVSADLSDMPELNYDVMIFFSPQELNRSFRIIPIFSRTIK